MIGIGAVKYADLSTERSKDYVFDWDRMLAFEGNTAPYLQYAHARICSIFRRSGIERPQARDANITLAQPEEALLARRLVNFAAVTDATLASYSPHTLCTHWPRPSPRSTRFAPSSRLETMRPETAGWHCAT
jgi:arginyl-tRNA synthetase